MEPVSAIFSSRARRVSVSAVSAGAATAPSPLRPSQIWPEARSGFFAAILLPGSWVMFFPVRSYRPVPFLVDGEQDQQRDEGKRAQHRGINMRGPVVHG